MASYGIARPAPLKLEGNLPLYERTDGKKRVRAALVTNVDLVDYGNAITLSLRLPNDQDGSEVRTFATIEAKQLVRPIPVGYMLVVSEECRAGDLVPEYSATTERQFLDAFRLVPAVTPLDPPTEAERQFAVVNAMVAASEAAERALNLIAEQLAKDFDDATTDADRDAATAACQLEDEARKHLRIGFMLLRKATTSPTEF